MKTLAALLVLALTACGDPAAKLSPTHVDDTAVPTNGFAVIAQSGTTADADGDPSTCTDLGTPDSRTLSFSSDAPVRSLNIISSLQTADGSISNGSASVSYSIDGGAMFTQIWSAHGAQGRPLTTDSIPLNGARANQIQVRFLATMPPEHFKGCEVWLER